LIKNEQNFAKYLFRRQVWLIKKIISSASSGMKKSLIFIAIFFIIAILCGFWLYTRLADRAPETPVVEREKPPANAANAPEKKIQKNFERDEKLQAETDRLLPLFDRMAVVPVYLKDEVINKEGTNTERGVAYTSCENDNQPVIFVKKVFYRKANRKMLVNILKHELTHAWQCRKGYTWGHDEIFRNKFKSVGGFGN
jgi:hypothetical protein